MVRSVLNLVYREVRGLHQAAYVLALFAFGSQLLALVRDRLLAHNFGAGFELDIYYAAFRIPDLLYVLFASTLSVYVLIPFVARARETDASDGKARELLSAVFSIFLVVYALLALVIAILAPVIVPHLFPGLSDDPQLVLLLRILLLQPFFLGVSSLFGVVTQLGHRFVLYALSPLLYNIGIIFGIVALEPFFGLAGLAYGVVLGALGHMAIQLPLMRTSSLRFGFATYVPWGDIKSVLLVSIPRAFTLSINQIVLLVFMGIASVMTVGSVSVFQFAYNLQSVPLAIIGVSYSVAAFPILAEFFAKDRRDEFILHITTALRHIIFWSFPVIALIIVLRAHVVRVVLGSGAFDWSDTRLTAAVLALLSVSLVAQAFSLLTIRAFYASGRTRVPFYSALVGAGTSIGAAYAFLYYFYAHESFQNFLVYTMRLGEVPGSEVLVLGMAYAVGMIVQATILIVLLARTFDVQFSWLPKHLGRSVGAAVLAGALAYVTLNFVVEGVNSATFVGIFIQGSLAGVVGVVGAVLAYWGLGSPELTEITGAFHRRLFKTDVVAPQEEIL